MYKVEKALIPKGDTYVPRYMITKEGECLDVVNRWLDINSEGSYLTGKRYAGILIKYFNYLDKFDMTYEQVTRKSVVSGFIKYLLYGDREQVSMEGQSSMNAVKNHIGVIKNFYLWLEDERMVEVNPIVVAHGSKNKKYANKKFLYGQIYEFEFRESVATKLRGKRKKTYRKWFLDEEIDRLVSHCRCDRDRCIILISYKTGARIGEILGIKMDEYDRSEKILKIRRDIANENEVLAKTLERDLYISDEVCETLDNYIMGERQDIECETEWSDYMFLISKGKNKGKPVGYHTILKAIKNTGERAGFRREDIITHSGRSTRAQKLVELAIDHPEIGITDNFIMDELGWSSIDTLKHYKKQVDSRLRKKVAERITEVERMSSETERKSIYENIDNVKGE